MAYPFPNITFFWGVHKKNFPLKIDLSFWVPPLFQN